MLFCPNCFAANSMKSETNQGESHINVQCSVCGFQDSGKREERALPVGIRLRSCYIIGRVLGIGGFGITYLAYDVNSGIRYAIKEYFPAEWAIREMSSYRIIPTSHSTEQLYHHGRDVFAHEAEYLRKLSHIPHIVSVRGYFTENETAYMVMDFLDGKTLRNYVRINGQNGIPFPLANQIIRDVGMSLQQIHQSMLLHRDIGPDNLILMNNQTVYLIDFGATRMYGLNSPHSMSVLVKEGFAPIEQYSRSGKQGPWTDIYALAATYYFLTTGVKPPSAPDRITGMKMVSLQERNPNVSKEVSKAIAHAMEEDWKHRPQTVGEFLNEMGLSNDKKISMGQSGYDKTIFLNDKFFWTNTQKIPSLLMQTGLQRNRYLLINNRYLY
ncbi:MAG: serine/threonine protein kinase, partial [Lachnospiraceae bacterium]|nr:serine/threonine protein kinase [Lachnospiraceae bacterium]